MPLTPEEARELLEQFISEPADTSAADDAWTLNYAQRALIKGPHAEAIGNLPAGADRGPLIAQLQAEAHDALQQAKKAVASGQIPDVWHWRPEDPCPHDASN